MSNHNDLQSLSKPELIQKIITARGIWHQDQKTIESLTNQCGDAAAKVEEQKKLIAQKEEYLQSLREKLHQAGEQMMELWCKAKTAYRVVEPYHKVEEDDKGGQHESAPSQ